MFHYRISCKANHNYTRGGPAQLNLNAIWGNYSHSGYNDSSIIVFH